MTESSSLPPATAPSIHVTAGLATRSFWGLMITQFLGATNDNIFRWLIIPIGVQIVGKEHEPALLTMGTVMFVIPYILFASLAGYLADRFAKRTVIVGCKMAEVLLMTCGIVAILWGNIHFLYVLLFLMGTHSALFGPSKYGVLPEIVRTERLAVANGLVGMSTILAIVLGTIIGGRLYHWTGARGQNDWWISAAVLIGVAAMGLAGSLMMFPTRAANPQARFPWNIAGETYRDLATLASRRPLLWAALASALFWSLGSLVQMNVYLFASNDLVIQPHHVGPLLGILALGVGLGNVLAGWWSKGRIELGIVFVGALGITAGHLLIATVPQPVLLEELQNHSSPLALSYLLSAACLFLLGLGAGMYDVPLQTFLQHRSPTASRGAILAAANFIAFSGMILASGVFYLLSGVLKLSGKHIFLTGGLIMLPVLAGILYALPIISLRFIFWLLTRWFYRVRIEGASEVPAEGGALLVANHVSWLDAMMLMTYGPRPVRMVAYSPFRRPGILRWLSQRSRAIPLDGSDGPALERTLRSAREALADGEIVCVFPEGGMTRSGQLQVFDPSFLAMAAEHDYPIVPVYLGGFWGSVFSYFGGRFFWKIPRQVPYPVSITFGRPLRGPSDVPHVRRAIEELGVQAMNCSRQIFMPLARQFLRACRRGFFRSKVADTTGVSLGGGRLLASTLVLRKLLRRNVLEGDEPRVGVLLPPSVGAVLVNAALAVDRRVAVNLNYTLGSGLLNDCIHQCGIRHVISSRRMLERFPLKLDAELVFLEDLQPLVRRIDKLRALAVAALLPACILERALGLHKVQPDGVLTIIFTSGSTGRPKGVVLSQNNVASNIEAFDAVLDLRRDDVLLGILPFFHAFGYTVTLWAALALDVKGAYHYSPLEPKPIGQLCRQHHVTVAITAPTFLYGFIRRCDPADFKSVQVVISGSERLLPRLADDFEKKFGIRPVEGYGTTELSPVVSVNIPSGRARGAVGAVSKEGTVGLPFPGVTAKIVDPETGGDLGTNQAGLLLIAGPNVMQGYFQQPEATAQVMRGPWYITGDIAAIDEDGFIRITGRESRFSKIGGEMVPHLGIEEALARLCGSEGEEIRVAVTAVPDSRKGERLIVFHTGLELPPDQICRLLVEQDLPPLWVPSPENIYQVEALPLLGSGKLDLQRLKALALEKAGLAP